MSKNNIHDASTYPFCSDDKVLIDANIWLYLFSPPCNPQRREAKQYGQVFKKMQAAKVVIVTDQFLISEYLNTYARIEFGAVRTHYNNNYKYFRRSSDFLHIATAASSFAKKILSLSIHHENMIDLTMITNAVNDFQKAKIEFNDSFFVQLCQRNHYKLLTNDFDFYSSPIEIITCQPKMLHR